MTVDNRIAALYLALLAFHIAHVFEELWGRFFLMNAVFGMGWYLAANWAPFCIPLAVFYFLLRGSRRAVGLALIYAAVMVVNGIGHNIATIVTGRYFDGFAGGATGIGLALVGIPLCYYLWKAVRPERADEPA